MNEPAAHAEQWRDYHARWIWFLGVWVGGFMVFSGLLMISPALPDDAGLWITAAAGVLWVLGFFATMIRLLWFACPRCGKPFSLLFYSLWWPISGKCLHCGLRSGE